jgi:hypothetical protein
MYLPLDDGRSGPEPDTSMDKNAVREGPMRPLCRAIFSRF